jgi:membrane protein required for colicin V production
MTPLIFDLIIAGLVLLSVAIGYLRGFCNEVFTIFGWIAAVIATIYFTPVLLPFGQKFIEKEWLARMATSSAIFLVTLGVCSGVSYIATRTLRSSKLGMVDRIMGFGFGILRAIVLLGLGYLLFTYVFKEDNRPDFVTKARTKPFLEASAEWIQAVVPLNSTLGIESKPEDAEPKQSVPASNDKLASPTIMPPADTKSHE